MAGTVWLVVGLAASFSTAASLWVGRLARENILQQHARRLSLETDQLAIDASQALEARLSAMRAAIAIAEAARLPGSPLRAREVFAALEREFPEYGWIVASDAEGAVDAAHDARLWDRGVANQPWYDLGRYSAWIGSIDRPAAAEPAGSVDGPQAALGDMASPVRATDGALVGVIAARLSWRSSSVHAERLTEASDPADAAQALVIDARGVVDVGPASLRGRPWPGVARGAAVPVDAARNAARDARPLALRFEDLPDGRSFLVARAAIVEPGAEFGPRWRVQLAEPREHVYLRADALEVEILWISLGLGALTALGGALGARHLTGRLKRLTLSAATVGRGEARRIDVPSGADEVAQLAAAFSRILDDLQQERSDLKALSAELERRVAVRTREVERLAEESRYAAVVRERLKIARDLHDTLAHSMMAMLSEVRLLRRLHAHDPGALAEELARAEQVAHDGLREARTAITQMRVNAVRDTGLGAALASAFERFIDRSGLLGQFSADPEAARFGDERAETLFRMAEEALRNVERHASAAHVGVALTLEKGTDVVLRIEDDGIGFDPAAAHPGHFGLVGLREQAQLIGADLGIESAPGSGTRLTVALRMTPEVL